MHNKHVAYKDEPFDDNGNRIVQVPEPDSYSRTKGIMKSIPEL